MRLDLSQSKLAVRSELSLRYIQDLEAGNYHPPIKTLLRLKTTLRCRWEDFYFGCSQGV